MSDLNIQSKKPRLGRGLGSLLSTHIVDGEPEAVKREINQKTSIQNSQTTQPVATAVEMKSTPSASTVTVAPVVPPESRIWNVGIDKLVANEFQPRQIFEKEKLEELSASIKEKGILQPIVARKLEDGKLEIIAGERRWRAAQLAGLHSVPVILKKFNNQESLELAIIENIQRENLNPIEEADAFQRLATEFNLTQQQVADKVGKDRATVANAMRLLALPSQIKEMINKSMISAGHAKVLLGLQDPHAMVQIAKLVVDQKLSVRATEKLVSKEAKAEKQNGKEVDYNLDTQVKERLINGLAEELQKILGTKVTIDYSDSKGKVAIHFYSDDELTNLVDKLKK